MISDSNLAVCTWSLRPEDANDFITQLEATGIKRVQLNLDPLREQPSLWSSWPELSAKHGITTVSGMFGTVGEDYSTLDSIKKTGGVVPDATWEQNWKNIQTAADIAKQLGLKTVTFHAGFLPHEATDPAFKKLLQRITMIADLFAKHGIQLGFETGQETAETLREFLQLLGKPNVGVNFDPANMLLYDKGDPIAALKTLSPFLKQCHIKDANKTKTSGTWGEEVVVGTGQVDWKAFFRDHQANRVCREFLHRARGWRTARCRYSRGPPIRGSIFKMKTVNIGVAGMGFMGATHIKAYLKIPGARIGAICDAHRLPIDGDLSSISGNIGDGKPLKLDMTQVKAYLNFDELLADPSIDLVDLCVPTPQHHPLSLAALRAGKHVICEKPLARTPEQCREIVVEAAKSKGFFMPAMVMRFWPEWAWLKDAITSGSYGKVLAARFRRVSAPPGWSKASYFKGNDSGGALLDLHIHDTDFIQFCFGRPKSVFFHRHNALQWRD